MPVSAKYVHHGVNKHLTQHKEVVEIVTDKAKHTQHAYIYLKNQ